MYHSRMNIHLVFSISYCLKQKKIHQKITLVHVVVHIWINIDWKFIITKCVLSSQKCTIYVRFVHGRTHIHTLDIFLECHVVSIDYTFLGIQIYAKIFVSVCSFYVLTKKIFYNSCLYNICMFVHRHIHTHTHTKMK